MKKFGDQNLNSEPEEESGDLDILQMYLDEMKAIPPFEEGEEERLLRESGTGKADGRKRIAEGNLKYAMSFIREFLSEDRADGERQDGNLSIPDMISETNLALVKAVDMGISSGMTAEKLHDTIAEEVRNSLKQASEAQNAQELSDSGIADKVNALSEATEAMARELGRQATVKELAERMQMTEDEILEILKMVRQAMEN